MGRADASIFVVGVLTAGPLAVKLCRITYILAARMSTKSTTIARPIRELRNLSHKAGGTPGPGVIGGLGSGGAGSTVLLTGSGIRNSTPSSACVNSTGTPHSMVWESAKL